jgi:D-serine deaminase-like pyridoxal phosphate-dependent protein
MPTLLLDRQKCLRNIEIMARKAEQNSLVLRPHCKTHQSAEVAGWFRDFGVSALTVSSFPMARYFAEAGWKDILVAFPFQPGETEALTALSSICELSILVDSPAVLPFLHHLPRRVGFYIDIDSGYGRTGVRTENPELIEQIIVKAAGNPQLEFRGFYCHAGHSYKAGSQEEMNDIHRKAVDDLGQLKKAFSAHHPKILYGDTPNCSTQHSFGEVDELTPGNFVFYDLVQSALGACSPEEIAVAMECPVAGRYPSGDRIVIHGGGVHFSKESLLQNGKSVYGQLVEQSEAGWKEASTDTFLSSISQEHGVLKGCGHLVRKVNIGDTLLFLPVHSCLTANLMRGYQTLEGHIITTMNS